MQLANTYKGQFFFIQEVFVNANKLEKLNPKEIGFEHIITDKNESK